MSSVLPSLICMASRCKHAQLGFLLQQACTAWFPAADCKHVQFPAAKGTRYHASSHIITSYVLKRNWKQANKKESRALFFVCVGRAGLKMPFLFNASPQTFLANQDEFPPLKKRPPKNHPPKASPKKRPSKSLSSLRDRQSTLDKGYNSFREKFNGIRTPTKKLMIKKKRQESEQRKKTRKPCAL